ncbi:PTS system, beta-glucosides-specific IIC component [Peribacillus simplex]|uniref:PTS system, beta-glucosides-specific IIC component n=1 Tax=Peribacillus simplex TaxID=1478 RepID=A0A9X8RA89_9BACI|nr:beta-glucoside-specific PTS transporter subunit IIABC [Peribacillus simplex]SIR55726.1 PTS system, beta-glucosides-specific IIC component [Peribacillus simplex]
MNYKKLAEEIIYFVGGEENIKNVVHCATRLRFNLHDNKKAGKEKLENLDGVLSVVVNSGQFQVVIGSNVSEVFKEIQSAVNIDGEGTTRPSKQKVNIIEKVFEVISGSFSPLLGALAGAGMLRALIALLTMTGILSTDSGTYTILLAAGNAIFYFLPIFLGITISTKLDANPYVGGMIGATLLEPNFTGLLENRGDMTDFLDIPVVLMDYSSSVFPAFIAITIYALLNRYLKKIIHKDLQMFMLPMLALIIIVPLTTIAFGPIGVYIANSIGTFINFLYAETGVVTGAILGGSWTFLTLFGIHTGFTPFILENVAIGGDPILALVSASVFAQIGLAFGVFLKTKDKKLKALAGSTLMPGLFSGITEPILYGLALRYKRGLIYIAIAGIIGGGVSGLLGAVATAYAFPSMLSVPIYSPLISYVIAMFLAFAVSAGLTIVLGFEDKKTKAMDEKKLESEPSSEKHETILSPLSGLVKPLKEVNDSVFSSYAMGRGVAIEPTEGRVTSPVNGVVTMVFPTYHAIGIQSDEGGEILIHIGINTVSLRGEHFSSEIKQGDRVTQGQHLIDFNVEKIKEAGYEVITPIIITNTDHYIDFIELKSDTVQAKERLLTLVPN